MKESYRIPPRLLHLSVFLTAKETQDVYTFLYCWKLSKAGCFEIQALLHAACEQGVDATIDKILDICDRYSFTWHCEDAKSRGNPHLNDVSGRANRAIFKGIYEELNLIPPEWCLEPKHI